MNKEIIISEGLIIKPFEARVADDKLRAKVQYFQKLLKQQQKIKLVRKIKIRSFNA